MGPFHSPNCSSQAWKLEALLIKKKKKRNLAFVMGAKICPKTQWHSPDLQRGQDITGRSGVKDEPLQNA